MKIRTRRDYGEWGKPIKCISVIIKVVKGKLSAIVEFENKEKFVFVTDNIDIIDFNS